MQLGINEHLARLGYANNGDSIPPCTRAKGAPDGKPRGGFMVPLVLCAREILSAAGRVPVAPTLPTLCLSLLFTIRLFVSTRT